jgi:hypothetical protein
VNWIEEQLELVDEYVEIILKMLKPLEKNTGYSRNVIQLGTLLSMPKQRKVLFSYHSSNALKFRRIQTSALFHDNYA